MNLYDEYNHLPESYHTDPRWIEVERLRMEGRCAEAKWVVRAIREEHREIKYDSE